MEAILARHPRSSIQALYPSYLRSIEEAWGIGLMRRDNRIPEGELLVAGRRVQVQKLQTFTFNLRRFTLERTVFFPLCR